MIQFLAALSALAVIITALHANVVAAGGWRAPEAPMIAAICAMIAFGMAFATYLWRNRNKSGAIFLGLCLLAGEVYWIAINADRELTSRQTAAGPAIAAADALKKATERVTAAEKAKITAFADASEKAALPGCKTVCAQMLTDAKTTADDELTRARAAVSSIKPTAAHTALAGKLGVADWLYDLILATLRSLVILGASVAVALSLHPKPAPTRGTKSHDDDRSPLPHVIAPLALVAEPQPLLVSASAETPHKVVPTPPKPRTLRQTPTVQPSTEPTLNVRAHVAKFALASFVPAADTAMPLKTVMTEYLEWCARTGEPILPPAALARELRELFERSGRTISNGTLPGVALRQAA